MDGMKSVDASFISAITVMKAWFPAYANAMLRTAEKPCANVGLPTTLISRDHPGGAVLGLSTPKAIMTMSTAEKMDTVAMTAQVQLSTFAGIWFSTYSQNLP